MLGIYSIKDSPRLRYIAKILFGTVLGVEYEIVAISDNFDFEEINVTGKPAIVYGVSAPDMISIPDKGLLFEDGIKRKEVRAESGEIAKLRFGSGGGVTAGYSIDFDIFSSAFFLITQYESYQLTSFDSHGRYNENSGIAYKNGFQNKPVIDIYAAYLWKALETKYPDLQRKKRVFDYRITFDVAAPYLYRHKGFFL